jgi:uncharacterized protein (TIGR02246 family)
MKACLYALTTALVVAAVAPVVLSAAPEGEAAIRQACNGFVTGWNKHDAKAMAALWAEDGDLINPFCAEARGWGAIETFLAQERSMVMGASTDAVAESKIRRLSPTFAATDWTASINALDDPNGVVQPPFVHHVFVLFELKNGPRRAECGRASAFAPPPHP